MPNTIATNSSPRNSIPMREEEVNRFRESLDIFDKLFKILFAVIAFKTTDMGEAFFVTHPNVMKVMILMFVLYFLLWFLGTMLPQHIGNFLMILVCIKVVIGSFCSVLVLTIISSSIAWLTVMLWLGVFALIAYYRYLELVLYKLIAGVILDIIKKLIDSYNMTRSRRLPV